MCSTSFVAIDGASPFFCEYLLAKFVVCCIFSGACACHICCVTEINWRLLYLFSVIAIAYEALVLSAFIGGLVIAVLVAMEMLSCVLFCFCFCFIMPLVERARERGSFPLYNQHTDFIATAMVCAAIREAFVLIFCPQRPTPADTLRDFKRDALVMVDIVRSGINMA
jgi:hypothetical protein